MIIICHRPLLTPFFFSVKQDHLPGIFAGRVAKNVDSVIVSSEFEVTMCGVEPAIQYIHDFNTAFIEVKALRSFLATISGITLNLPIQSLFASAHSS